MTDPSGLVPFASYLAGTINDFDKDAGLAGGSSYAVTCIVAPRHVFAYRTVTLNLRALGDKRDSNLAQYLTGDESCTPIEPTISNKLFATAGIASHFLARENMGLDGYFSTIASIAGFDRQPPYAFPDSSNSLEDTLGLVSALAVSVIPLEGEGASAAAMDGHGGNSSATFEVTRLGYGNGVALWLLVPPLCSLLIFSSLAVMSSLGSWAPGGEAFIGTQVKRPGLYAAESVYRMVQLGWIAGNSAKPEIDPLQETSDD
ncbi:hypothetical protein F4780DRAFT_730388, partial [Xylariomycetidae sp. FL0641]